MHPTLLVLALWSTYIAALHTLGGEVLVVRPFRAGAAVVEPFARTMMLVVWHMVTWALVTLAGSLFLAAARPGFVPLVALAGVQVAGFVVVFVWTARRELGAAIRLPQWLLLGPLAAGLLAMAGARPAALAAGLLIGILGVAHLAWACGSTFPARDGAQLAAHVLPPRRGDAPARRIPGRLATLAVMAVLFAMSATVLVPASRPGVLVVATIFALRGLVGLAAAVARRGARDSSFALHDRLFYAPGCLLIAALTATSVLP